MDLLYRRVMDWDVEPTAFSEFVTLDSGSASELVFTSNDGFASADPLDGPSDLGLTGDFTDEGPDDHGALFDFDFGSLPAGDTKSFITYYGAAANEEQAIAALAAVGAEAFSFGQTEDDPTGGTPNTFIFAFGNVGGSPIFGGEDEEPSPTPRSCIPPLIGFSCGGQPGGGGGSSQAQPTATAAAGSPTAAATTVAPTAVPAVPTQPGGGAGTGILAPDTGTGDGSDGTGGGALPIAMAAAAAGVLISGAALVRRRLR